LQHTGPGSVAADQGHPGRWVAGEMLHQPLGIGAGTGGKNGDTDHGAKVVDPVGFTATC
jgi:hypothetical protein